MKLEIGKTYLTRDGEHVARIISLIGKWSKRHPAVGEFYTMIGKKLVADPGMFQTYEHWTKDGRYLDKETDSGFDLMKEIE